MIYNNVVKKKLKKKKQIEIKTYVGQGPEQPHVQLKNSTKYNENQAIRMETI